MKNRTMSPFAFAAVLAVLSTPGHALSFGFSFDNAGGGTMNGTVTGEIQGLSDNATSSATAVIIKSYPTGLAVTTYHFHAK
jgi:hypothetical protein